MIHSALQNSGPGPHRTQRSPSSPGCRLLSLLMPSSPHVVLPRGLRTGAENKVGLICPGPHIPCPGPRAAMKETVGPPEAANPGQQVTKGWDQSEHLGGIQFSKELSRFKFYTSSCPVLCSPGCPVSAPSQVLLSPHEHAFSSGKASGGTSVSSWATGRG